MFSSNKWRMICCVRQVVATQGEQLGVILKRIREVYNNTQSYTHIVISYTNIYIYILSLYIYLSLLHIHTKIQVYIYIYIYIYIYTYIYIYIYTYTHTHSPEENSGESTALLTNLQNTVRMTEDRAKPHFFCLHRNTCLSLFLMN